MRSERQAPGINSESEAESEERIVELVPKEYMSFVPRTTYSRGIRYVMSHGNLPWLVDAVARHLGSNVVQETLASAPPNPEPHLWRLDVDDRNRGTLTGYANCKLCYVCQRIPFVSRRASFDFFVEKRRHVGNWHVCLPFESESPGYGERWGDFRQVFPPSSTLIFAIASRFFGAEVNG